MPILPTEDEYDEEHSSWNVATSSSSSSSDDAETIEEERREARRAKKLEAYRLHKHN